MADRLTRIVLTVEDFMVGPILRFAQDFGAKVDEVVSLNQEPIAEAKERLRRVWATPKPRGAAKKERRSRADKGVVRQGRAGSAAFALRNAVNEQTEPFDRKTIIDQVQTSVHNRRAIIQAWQKMVRQKRLQPASDGRNWIMIKQEGAGAIGSG